MLPVGLVADRPLGIDRAGGQVLDRELIIVRRQRKLREVVQTRTSPRGLAGRLHGRQQQPHQHADDGNHHQKFYQGKTTMTYSANSLHEFTPHWRW